MTGLKTYLPLLSTLLDTTPTALYERQKVLTRMMETIEGRGPGSGVRANNRSVTLLIIAVLSTDSVADTYSQTITIGAAKPLGTKCALTGTTAYSHALAEILADQKLSDRVVGTTVNRSAGTASIKYRSGRKVVTSDFVSSQVRKPMLLKEVTLTGAAIGTIQWHLADMQKASRNRADE